MDYDARLLVPEDADVPLRDRILLANEMFHEHQSRGGIWPNRLLVSIHSNAGPSPKGGVPYTLNTSPFTLSPEAHGASFIAPSGWECHVSGKSYNAMQLAGHLYQQAFERLLQCFPIRGKSGVIPRDYPEACPTYFASQPKVSDFYILHQAPCMAVLTENLFMDSPKDCAWLLTEEGRDTLAHIHAFAISSFIPAHANEGSASE